MKILASRMGDYADLYYSENQGKDIHLPLSLIAQSMVGAKDEWLVYELKGLDGDGHCIRYIFVGSEIIPVEVVEYLLDVRYFIVDVLRPSSDKQRLWVTAEDSLRSAREHGGVDETITVFTACQGSDLDALKRANPKITFIEKARVGELNRLISNIVVKSFANG